MSAVSTNAKEFPSKRNIAVHVCTRRILLWEQAICIRRFTYIFGAKRSSDMPVLSIRLFFKFKKKIKKKKQKKKK